MSSEYFLDIAREIVKGVSRASVLSFNPDVDIGAPETVWEQGGIYTYLPDGIDTELFMSSTSAADTNISLKIEGMTSDYLINNVEVTFIGGQSQQTIGSFFRIFKITVISGGAAPVGDMYLAESGALTNGVPNTISEIKAKMIQGSNITQLGLFTVPANHTMYIVVIVTHIRKNKDAVISLIVKPEGFPDFIQTSQFPNFQNSFQLPLDPPFAVKEKTDVEIRATTTTNQTEVSANIGYILVNDLEA